MAEGTSTYMGLAVPLFGESEIRATTAANDILTFTGAASQSGDFIVCQHSTATTEKVVIDYQGNITNLGATAVTGAVTGASLDVTGQVEAATLAVTGIGTLNLSAQNTGTASFQVDNLTTSDVVIVSPREDTDDGCFVAQVALSTLTLRNIASEGADVEFNYLVISKT